MSRKIHWLAAAVLALGAGACGDDDDATSTASNASAAADLTPFLLRTGEQPGFRPGALPGAMPRSRDTITGVDAFVQEMGLPPADARRLRSEGFISFTAQPIRGPRKTAGVANVILYKTAEGAKHGLAHDVRPDVIREAGPVEDLRFFTVPGVPSVRGWTASEPHVGNVFWVQGRCVIGLGNQGPGPFVGSLSAGVRAIYQRTEGRCP